MCGIAAIVSGRGCAASVLDQMSATLAHRGPDGHGGAVWRPGEGLRVDHGRTMAPAGRMAIGLAHRRLAVIAPGPACAQPFRVGAAAIAFNGEVYNHRELRRRLQERGHVFTTEGDTEVVLRAWLEWGEGAFERLFGMWGLAILDSTRGRLILSRDRLGIKPLYWTAAGGDLVFASELKALLCHPGAASRPDPAIAARFLCDGVSDEGESTFFSGLRAFPPGCWASVEPGQPDLQPRRFWELPPPERGGAAPTPPALGAALRQAVSDHLVSDVPVGSCLSGGIDSSAILCLARQMDSSRPWVGVGFVPAPPGLDESRWMALAAGRAGARLETVRVGSDALLAALPTILRVQDEPFGSLSIAAQYFVFARARALGLTVMLDGQGADELFAGYPAYRHVLARQMVRSFAWGRAAAMRRSATDLPMWSLLAGAVTPETLRHRLGAAARSLRAIAPGLAGSSSGAGLPGLHNDLGRALRADLCRTRLPALLRFEDRNSMAHGIEARVPFLDHRLVEMAQRLSPESLLADGLTKAPLRRALAGIVPDEILGRSDKVGFTADPAWIVDVLNQWGPAMLENQTEAERDWFSRQGVARLFSAARADPAARGAAAWRVINLKAWLRGSGMDAG